MRTSKLLSALLISAGLTLPFAARADSFIDIDINIGTPRQAAYVPAPRPGPVHGAGYRAWDGRHTWDGGVMKVTHPAYGTAYYDLRYGYPVLYDVVGDMPRKPAEAMRANYRSQRD